MRNSKFLRQSRNDGKARVSACIDSYTEWRSSAHQPPHAFPQRFFSRKRTESVLGEYHFPFRIADRSSTIQTWLSIVRGWALNDYLRQNWPSGGFGLNGSFVPVQTTGCRSTFDRSPTVMGMSGPDRTSRSGLADRTIWNAPIPTVRPELSKARNQMSMSGYSHQPDRPREPALTPPISGHL